MPNHSTVARTSRLLATLVVGTLVSALAVAPRSVVPVFAAGTVDQQQTTSNNFIFAVAPNIAVGQTFTAGLTGRLDQVDLQLRLRGATAASIGVEIRTAVGNLPGPTVLASATISAASLPTADPPPFTSIPFTSPAPVVAGTQYALVFDLPENVVTEQVSTVDVYAGGRFSRSGAGRSGPYSPFPPVEDLVFRTYVTQATVSVGPRQVPEGNSGTTNLVFPVTLSFPVGAAVTAPYTLANGTATGGPACTAGIDFVNTGGTITIPAGATSGTITVPGCGDTLAEVDETFTVTLGTPTNAVLGTASAIGTLRNDDGAPAPPPSPPAPPTAQDAPNDPNNDDEEDEKPKETEDQRRNRERTNAGPRGDITIEGNAIAVERAPELNSLLVTIGMTRGETQVVQVPCFGTGGATECYDIRVGDYLEADGYQNGVGDPNTYFVASDSVEVTRNGRRVK